MVSSRYRCVSVQAMSVKSLRVLSFDFNLANKIGVSERFSLNTVVIDHLTKIDVT